MNDRRKKFKGKINRVRLPEKEGISCHLPPGRFDSRNDRSIPSASSSFGNNAVLPPDYMPSTSGGDNSIWPPPGLKGKALGLWHRDNKRKEKRLAKKEKNELKSKQNELKKFTPLKLREEKIDKIKKIIGDVNFGRIKQLSANAEPPSGPGSNIHDKYVDMQESDFKRRFIKSITGSLEDRIKGGTLHMSSLRKSSELDCKYKKELENKYVHNQEFKYFLEVRKKLPAFEKKREIIDALDKTNKILISGETGCGKTTQVAQFLLEHEIESNRGSTCSIICTQPRRISAISVAERVAAERGERIGTSVGYQIRLEKKTPREACSILFCTTGVLLKYLQSEPLLRFASHIVLDEIHERDTLSDFVITLLKDILPVRPDLKVILMSATMNAEKFSKYFENCPTIHIPGFTFPVTEYYLEDVLSMTGYKFINSTKKKPMGSKELLDQREQMIMPYIRKLESQKKYPRHVTESLKDPTSEDINLELVVDLVTHICSAPESIDGAVLIFLPGWDKILKLNKMMNERSYFSQGRFVIMLLHSMVPTESQKAIFDRPPPGKRKIIIATNIAETSITIDDVVYVIDCGKIKIKNFDTENNITTMKEEWVSLANARQRRGRAGRVQKGHCFHMFTRVRENMFDQYQLPEMLRTRLEEVILHVKILQLGKITPFLSKVLDPPSPKAVELSLKLLQGMRALDEEENLTPLGYHLGNLPVDPQAGKMLILASLFCCFDPIASIAACLGSKDPFVTPIGKEREVDQKKKELSAGMKSDHLLISEVVSMWERAEERGRGLEFCRSNFLSRNTLSLLRDMKNQFGQHLYQMKFLSEDKPRCTSANLNSNYPGLLKAIICAGLYPNIAIIKKQKFNKKTGNGIVILHSPGDGRVQFHLKSVNNKEFDFPSKFVVYFEKIKSTGIFLHDATMVTPLALIFFCQNLTVTDNEHSTGKVLAVSDCIKFTCSSFVAQLIEDLRIALDWILETKISHPGVSDLCDPCNDSKESRLLRAIVELITIEDEQVNSYESDCSDEMYWI